MKYEFTEEQWRTILESGRENIPHQFPNFNLNTPLRAALAVAISLIPEPAAPEPAPQVFWRLLGYTEEDSAWKGDEEALVDGVWTKFKDLGAGRTMAYYPAVRRFCSLPPNPPPLEWISRETPPTDADADSRGCILISNRSVIATASWRSYANLAPEWVHWLPGKALENLPKRPAPDGRVPSRVPTEAVGYYREQWRC